MGLMSLSCYTDFIIAVDNNVMPNGSGGHWLSRLNYFNTTGRYNSLICLICLIYRDVTEKSTSQVRLSHVFEKLDHQKLKGDITDPQTRQEENNRSKFVLGS